MLHLPLKAKLSTKVSRMVGIRGITMARHVDNFWHMSLNIKPRKTKKTRGPAWEKNEDYQYLPNDYTDWSKFQ